ncbi:phage tail tape measure protein [Shewanella sp.]|uniref:phage tail tape measure protein n=1 Tax=Shewanella sp. TaxID=50422 RepID=UPI003A96D113
MLPNQLNFIVSLTDQITKPIANISKQFNGLASNYQAGSMKMMTGAAGVGSAWLATTNALRPAMEMDAALGEVNSLGVQQSALKQLANTAYDYATQYGGSATDFVKSSYDIQSAITGLNDSELSRFTMASNVLAKGTKADAATITNYMGTMYGIFKNNALAMGKSNWVEQVTGMTASAVQMFKTTGAEMSGAFTSLGADAQSAGISMNEQMAVLGTLQATMSGSEAGTKYRAFLAGVGKAQKALGLTFTDSNGRLLPMMDILQKIKGAYGDTIDQAESDSLAAAFGSQEASGMLKLLLNDVTGLGDSINTLGKIKGMDQATKMAQSMTQQSDRLAQSWYVIRAAFGTAILPTVNDFLGGFADMSKSVVAFTQEHPVLTKALGYTALAIAGLVALGGMFTIAVGAANMAMVTWGVATTTFSLIAGGLSSALGGLRAIMFALNIVMWANPIMLIVGGIVAAIAAVGLLIYYWDDLKAAMSEWGWLNKLKTMFAGVINWIIDKLNMIPGIDIDKISMGAESPATPPASPQVAAISPLQPQFQQGGVSQQISNANSQKSTQVGTVNVYPQKGDSANFMNYVEMRS